MKRIILFLVLLLAVNAFAGDQDTLTQRELRTWVRHYLGGVATSSMWSDGTIDDLVNLACREYALLVGIPKTDTVLTVSADHDYALASDFLRIRGVTIYNLEGDKREKALLYRSPRSMGAKTKAFGEDDDQTHPSYYTITGHDTDDGSFLVVDPAEEESDRDTLIVYYYAQAVEMAGNDTISNIPYEGVPMVVYSAVRSCLIKNREYPALNNIDKYWETSFNLLIREQSDLEFDPNAQ